MKITIQPDSFSTIFYLEAREVPDGMSSSTFYTLGHLFDVRVSFNKCDYGIRGWVDGYQKDLWSLVSFLPSLKILRDHSICLETR